MTGSAMDITEEKESQDKYRMLYEAIDEGFLVSEVIFDENGKPVDMLYLETNPAGVRLLGQDFTGHRISELNPDFDRFWLDVWERVLRTGTGERLERYAKMVNTWFSFFIFRLGGPGSRLVGSVFKDITSRKLAEQAIAADLRDTRLLQGLGARLVSEENPQVLYQEVLSTAIALTNADAGTVQILDQDSQELFLLATCGFSHEMTGHFARVDASSLSSCGMALASGQRMFVDFNLPGAADPDGTLRLHREAGYCSAQSTPLITRSGKPIGMISTHWAARHRPTERELRFLDLLARQAADLIDRMRAEQALREREAHLRETQEFVTRLVNTSFEGIWSVDSAGQTTFVNQRAAEILGYTVEEIQDKSAFEFLMPQDQQAGRETLARIIAGESGRVEAHARHKDGSERWLLVAFSPLYDEQGRFQGAMAMFNDITERKQMEKELADSERRYRELIQYAPTAIYEIDFRTRRFTSVNDSMVELSGYSREELLQMDAYELLDEEGQALFSERIRKWLSGEQPDENVEYRVRAKDGHTIFAVLSVTFKKDEQGRPLGATVVGHDVTERKRAEQALRASAARDAYRVQLADALRPLADPDAVKAAASRVLGEYLQAGRVHYADIDEDQNTFYISADYCREGYHSIVGRLRFEDYGDYMIKPLLAGRTLAIADVNQVPGLSDSERAAHAALRVESYVVVPLIRGGRLLATMAVNLGHPRAWTADEVALIEETAERTWAAVERARTERDLRKSEERFRSSIESLGEAFKILSAVRVNGQIVDFCYEYVNEAACKLTGYTREQIIGQTILQWMPQLRGTTIFDRFVQVVETGQPIIEQAFPWMLAEKDNRYVAYDIRISRFGGGIIMTINDVTEQVRLEAEHQEAVKQREVHHRLAEQREMERQSYARDIHDGPIQTLSSLAFNLQYLKEVYPDPALKVELDQISLSIKGAVQELRQVMNELRPPTVIRFGLAKAVQIHAENLRERYPQIQWNLRLTADGQLLPEQTCLALFRIYQEAVNNIIRHSEATEAWISYRVRKEHLLLEVRDNGIGFNGDSDIVTLTSNQHFGLAGISERAEAINGELEIVTRQGEGTIIRVKVPMRQ